MEAKNQTWQRIIEKGYKEACYKWKIITYRLVIFKGFYNEKIKQEILNNEQILLNLHADTPLQKKF